MTTVERDSAAAEIAVENPRTKARTTALLGRALKLLYGRGRRD